jgi:hypothetical protein
MTGDGFLRIVGEAFAPFLESLGFIADKPAISGREYSASFSSAAHLVRVSYEPDDDALFVMVFGQRQGVLSDIDSREETPRLADLNARYMPRVDAQLRAANEDFFRSVVPEDKEERLLLKAAKELRLVLPEYLEER